MNAGNNMICPGCGAFQPRAEVCTKCGVVIAKKAPPIQKPKVGPIPKKKANPAAQSATRPAANANTGKPPIGLIILAALIVVPVIGYILFSGTDENATTATENTDSTPTAKPGAKSQTERIATVNPTVADNLQRSQVQSKLSTLRTMLNLYSVENEMPLSNEEGLQALVAKGVVTQSEITDEWGNVFEYRLEWGKETALEREYKIYISSKGPDGVSGTPDDIGLP